MAVLDGEEDRRGAPRRPLDQIPRIVAVKVSSELVDVINASSTGLLVEGAFPVRPGMTSYVDLIEAAGNTVRVNGSIVRCQIASIGPNKLRYRFAIVFDRAGNTYIGQAAHCAGTRTYWLCGVLTEPGAEGTSRKTGVPQNPRALGVSEAKARERVTFRRA